MMRLLLSFFLLISIFTLNAQTQSVSIGTTDTNSKAILWLQGNGSQGLILPVASTAGFPANEAGEGSVVYDGSLQKVFYSNGVQWIDMAAGTGPGGIQTIGITGNEIILSSGGGTIGLAADAPTTSPGQLLMWNGSAWTTTSATVPTSAGQVLSWNGTSWEATTAATGGSLSADDVTIQLVSGVLAIKDGGVTDAKVAAGISGNKIAITPSGNLGSNNVQDAVAELQTDIDSKDASATNEIQEVSVTSGTGTTTPGESFSINNSLATGTGVTVQEGSGIQIDRTGNQLTINSTAAGTGTVTSIATGTGLAGGPITNAGTITLANTAVTAGTFGNATSVPQIIVDQQGRITSATNVSIAAGATTLDGLSDATVTTPTTGQILINNGTGQFQNISLNGDASLTNTGLVTINNNAVTSAKIADGTIAAADINAMSATNGQVLKFNGTNWLPSSDDVGGGATPTLNNGQILTGNGTSNTASTLSGDATLNVGVLTISTGAVTSAKIADGTVAAVDLNSMGATNGQVLQYNGTTWIPLTPPTGATDINGLTDATVASPIAGNIIIHDGAGQFQNRALSGDATISGTGVLTIGNNTVGSAEITDASIATADLATGAVISTTISDATITATDIAAGTITSGNIADGTIAATDLNAMSATSGQVLQFNGTSWAPTTPTTGVTDINGLTDATIATPVAGNVLVHDGAGQFQNRALSGDATISGTGVLTIGNNTVGSAEITDASIATADLATGAVISTTISDATITATDIAAGTITSGNIADGTIAATDLNAMSATSGQVLQFNGTSWAPTTPTTGATDINGLTDATIATPVAGNVLVHDGAGQFQNRALSGDATISSTGVLTIGNNSVGSAEITDASIATSDLATGAVTSTTIADATITATDIAAGTITSGNIADGTIAASDLNAMSATNGQVLQFNGTNWLPTTLSVATNLDGLSDATVNTPLSGQILVHDGAGQFKNTDVTGDVTISSSGATTITTNAVSAAKLQSDAAIDANRAVNTDHIRDGAVTNAKIAAVGLGKLIQGDATTNQVLSWSGTTWAPVSLAATFSTINTIPKGDGTTQIASQIFDDGTSVGVGNTAPSALTKLHVTGGVGLENNQGIWWKNTAGTMTEALKIDNSNRLAMRGFGAGIRFQNGVGADVVTIDNTGNLGIGTVNPGNHLEILASVPNIRLMSTQTNTLSQAFLTFGHDDGTGGFLQTGSIGDVGSNDGLQLFSPFSINFNVNYQDRISFGSSGEIGVGNPVSVGSSGQVLSSQGAGAPAVWTSIPVSVSPASRMIRGNSTGTLQESSSVFDNSTFTGVGRSNLMTGSERFGIQADYGAGAFGGMYINANATGQPFYGYATGNTVRGYSYVDGNDLYKWKLYNGNGIAMTISINGETGIGTTTPASRLDVEGGITVGSSYSGTNAAPTDGAIIEGNVGIGTNASSYPLTVYNDASTRSLYIQNIYAGASTQYGLTVDMTSATGSSSKFGIDCNVSGTAASTGIVYGLETDVVPNGTGAAYGVNSVISSVGTGSRYGIYSSVSQAAANTSSVFGLFSSISDSGTGTAYGVYSTGEDANYFSGNVGIGTNNPERQLHVAHSTGIATNGVSIENTAASTNWNLYVASAGDFWLVVNGTQRGEFNATTGSYTTVSDRKLKDEIKPLDNVLSKVLQLQPSTYNFKSQIHKNQRHLGFIAQEVKELFPSMVTYSEENDIHKLDYSGFGVLAIKAIQEQQEMIQQQKAEIEKLKNELNINQQKTNTTADQLKTISAEMSKIKQALGMEAKATDQK